MNTLRAVVISACNRELSSCFVKPHQLLVVNFFRIVSSSFPFFAFPCLSLHFFVNPDDVKKDTRYFQGRNFFKIDFFFFALP